MNIWVILIVPFKSWNHWVLNYLKLVGNVKKDPDNKYETTLHQLLHTVWPKGKKVCINYQHDLFSSQKSEPRRFYSKLDLTISQLLTRSIEGLEIIFLLQMLASVLHCQLVIVLFLEVRRHEWGVITSEHLSYNIYMYHQCHNGNASFPTRILHNIPASSRIKFQRKTKVTSFTFINLEFTQKGPKSLKIQN